MSKQSDIKKNCKKLPFVDVLGFGDNMVDLTTQTPAIPSRGGNVWSSPVKMSHGGTVANVSVILARLGLRSAFVGCVGKDPFGDFSLQSFLENNVDISEFELNSDINTGIVLAMIDPTGERTFIACAKGAAHTRLSEEHTRKIDFQRTSIVHSSGVCLVEDPACSSLLLGLMRAKEAGRQVFFDPNLRLEGEVFTDFLRNAQMKALELVDVVLVGEDELLLLFDRDMNTSEIIQTMINMGVKTVVVKQSAQGATAYTSREKIFQRAYNVDVVDTTGAGDAFDAGFIAASFRNEPLREALKYACAVGGYNVTRIGARAVSSHEEILQFMSSFPET